LEIALTPSQEREPGRAFSDTSRRVEGHVKIVRFLPQMFRRLGCANLILKDRETSNSVREVEGLPVFMSAVDGKGFNVTRFGQWPSSRVVVGIAEVPNRMRESQRVVNLPDTGDGEFAFEQVSVVADGGHYDLL